MTTGQGLSSMPRLGLVASGALLACIMTGAQAPPAGVTISHPWMRYIAPGVPAAGYFTLNNNNDHPVLLSGAMSSACQHLAFHESVVQNGTARMNMVQSVTVSAHGAVTFEPGGYHLMCMSPAADIAPGHNVPITLQFRDGSSLSSDFPVYSAKGK